MPKILVKQIDLPSCQQLVNILNDPKQWTVMNFASIITQLDSAQAVEVDPEAQEAAQEAALKAAAEEKAKT